MPYTYDEDRCSLAWDSATQELTVTVKESSIPKRLIYGCVTSDMFHELVGDLEDEDVEGLQTVLDRWEH